MKLQIDSVAKTIKVEGNTNLKELVEHLQKLLPEDSPFGSWEKFSLETNTIINNWNSPIVIEKWRDWNGWQQPYYNTCDNSKWVTGNQTLTTSPNTQYYNSTVNLEIN